MAAMQSLDQQRSAYAWKAVPEKVDKVYLTLAKGAPALIMSNGLMQTLAFYQSKSKNEQHRDILAHIIGWLGRSFAGQTTGAGKIPAAPNFEQIMSHLQQGDSDLYIRATEEVLEILRWIRQFAAAKFASGPDEAHREEG